MQEAFFDLCNAFQLFLLDYVFPLAFHPRGAFRFGLGNRYAFRLFRPNYGRLSGFAAEDLGISAPETPDP